MNKGVGGGRTWRAGASRVTITLGLVSSLLVFGPLAWSNSAAAAKPSKATTYFAGKTLTFYSPTPAGGNDDLALRIIAPVMVQVLHAGGYVVQDYPTNGSVPEQDTVAAAVPNGLSIGDMDLNGDLNRIIAGEPNINFNPASVRLIGNLYKNSTLIAGTPTSPYHTIYRLLHAKAPVTWLEVYGGAGAGVVNALKAAYSAPFKVLTGYTSGHQVVQGFLRGDGQYEQSSTATLVPLVIAHQAIPLAVSVPIPFGMLGWNALHKVPTYADLEKIAPPKTKSGKSALADLVQLVSSPIAPLFVPRRTPNALVVALSAALHTALTTKSVETALELQSIVPGWVAPSNIHVTKFLKLAPRLKTLEQG